MLHVFYIQNHITKICMDSIIDHNEINLENVVIIVFEKYLKSFPPEDYYSSKIIKYKDKITEYTEKDKLKNFKEEWARYKYVKEITNNKKFILYTPTDNRDLVRHLIFLKKCVNYYLIEEGLASYFDYSLMKFKKNRFRLKYLILPKATQYLYQYPVNKYDKLKGGIGFSEFSFPYLKNKNIIPLKVQELFFSKFDESKPLLIFDGMIDYNHCSLDFLLNFLKGFIQKMSFNNFYFKFHVRQSDIERNEIIKLFDSLNLTYQELSGSIVIENLSSKYCVKMYGFYSSLLFYNKILGNGESFSLGQSFLEDMTETEKFKKSKSIFGDRVLTLFEKQGVIQI
jgi:hypothetical protein